MPTTTPSAVHTALLDVADDGAALTFTADGKPIATYTYRPTDAR